MGSDFYQDLESCQGAVFISHGGPIDGNFTVDAGGHGWFSPANFKSPYGNGSLRHVFFEACDSMDAVTTEQRYKSLLVEWLPAKYVNGLRTACGVDGELAALDRDGWRFFNRYNKGDSIEAAWLYSTVVEAAQNSPVTVAYGSSPAEALTTLTEGRFSKDRAEPGFAVASLWREIK